MSRNQLAEKICDSKPTPTFEGQPSLRRPFSFLNGLVTEISSIELDKDYCSPIHVYRRGPETTGETEEELCDTEKRLICMTGPVPGWGYPVMQYLGTKEHLENRVKEKLALENEIEHKETTTVNTNYESNQNNFMLSSSLESHIFESNPSKTSRRVQISEVVEVKTSEGVIKHEPLKDASSRLRREIYRKSSKWDSERRTNEKKLQEFEDISVLPPPTIVEPVNDQDEIIDRFFSYENVGLLITEGDTAAIIEKRLRIISKSFYESLYTYLISAFTILVYRSGIYKEECYTWKTVFGTSVPVSF